MKLNPDFVTYDTPEATVMVNAGYEKDGFSGVVRANSTAAKIIELLKEETTVDELLDALRKSFDEVPDEEVLRADVLDMLSRLREIGALAE